MIGGLSKLRNVRSLSTLIRVSSEEARLDGALLGGWKKDRVERYGGLEYGFGISANEGSSIPSSESRLHCSQSLQDTVSDGVESELPSLELKYSMLGGVISRTGVSTEDFKETRIFWFGNRTSISLIFFTSSQRSS